MFQLIITAKIIRDFIKVDTNKNYMNYKKSVKSLLFKENGNEKMADYNTFLLSIFALSVVAEEENQEANLFDYKKGIIFLF